MLEKKNRANYMAQMPYLVESLNIFAGLLNQHNSLSWWFILQWLTLLFLFFYFIFVQLSHVVHFVFTPSQFKIFNMTLCELWCPIIFNILMRSHRVKKIEDEVINKPSLVLSILDAVFTVSPNKQYRGILLPITPATQGPIQCKKATLHRSILGKIH